MINSRKYRKQIERMYEDVFTVSRHVNVKDPITKETKQELQPVHEDKPCKLSQTSLPRNGQTDAQNDLRYDAKLFAAPELEIKQGDLIAVTRKATGRTELYTAGEPFPPYSSHQEIYLERKDWA